MCGHGKPHEDDTQLLMDDRAELSTLIQETQQQCYQSVAGDNIPSSAQHLAWTGGTTSHKHGRGDAPLLTKQLCLVPRGEELGVRFIRRSRPQCLSDRNAKRTTCSDRLPCLGLVSPWRRCRERSRSLRRSRSRWRSSEQPHRRELIAALSDETKLWRYECESRRYAAKSHIKSPSLLQHANDAVGVTHANIQHRQHDRRHARFPFTFHVPPRVSRCAAPGAELPARVT